MGQEDAVGDSPVSTVRKIIEINSQGNFENQIIFKGGERATTLVIMSAGPGITQS